MGAATKNTTHEKLLLSDRRVTHQIGVAMKKLLMLTPSAPMSRRVFGMARMLPERRSCKVQEGVKGGAGGKRGKER
jgi:hypothetical protein